MSHGHYQLAEFAIHCPDSAKPEIRVTSGDQGLRVAQALRTLVDSDNSPDADLARVVEAWPALPETIRKTILAVLRSGE